MTDVRDEWRREHRRRPIVRAVLALARAVMVPRWMTRTEFDAEVNRMLGLAPHEMDAERRRLGAELRAMRNRRRA